MKNAKLADCSVRAQYEDAYRCWRARRRWPAMSIGTARLDVAIAAKISLIDSELIPRYAYYWYSAERRARFIGGLRTYLWNETIGI